MHYDASGDAERLATPLRQWAKLGFIRGLVGLRSDIGPDGRMTLPSAAFHEAAASSIGDPEQIGREEYEARRAYADAVEARLRDIQSDVIATHYRNVACGWVVDLVLGILYVLCAYLIGREFGALHVVTLAFISLIAIKTVLLQMTVRRLIKYSLATFQAESSTIRMPWQRSDGTSLHEPQPAA